ncbi:MAG: histidine kinase [Betaproteobacteria bacterium]|nr:histidine kinase [Betaproteobacteria bacterium]
MLRTAAATDHDVVGARQAARQVAAALGYDLQDQTRIATAVSEIARNARRYARDGEVEFSIEGESAPQLLLVRVSDKGPGIPHLDAVLAGRYRSRTGMGMGLIGAQRLMDQCQVRTGDKGTEVMLKKILPARSPYFDAERIAAVARTLAAEPSASPFEEIQQQNRELVRALSELRERQDELSQLNGELEDTNRGVVALYAELDEKADHLRRADQMKSRFLSNMSHEFRTPLNSIRALSKILLARGDGDLTSEQEKQVEFIEKAAQDLRVLVDDLLDLAKIEAGKIEVHPVEVSVPTLFSALRGMLRPLLVGDSVNLKFVEPAGMPLLYTDEAKVSQILRNFISNSLKFTEHGEIRVSATYDNETGNATFSVADTGIGIRPEDHETIFEEFTQVKNPLQSRARGTGLGLPLCRRLAQLLGGTIGLDSEPGTGSTFFASIPAQFADHAVKALPEALAPVANAMKIPLLVVDDDEVDQMFYAKVLRETCYEVFPARTLREARRMLQNLRPAAIILDIIFRGEDSWHWLGELKKDATTRGIPVIMISNVTDARKAELLGADASLDKPVERAVLLEKLNEVTRRRILVVEDEASLRYTIKRILERDYYVMEAANGCEALHAAATLAPSLVVLDLGLPDIDGREVLNQLRQNPATASLPVLIATSGSLTDEELGVLTLQAGSLMSKYNLNDRLLEAVAGAMAQAAQP